MKDSTPAPPRPAKLLLRLLLRRADFPAVAGDLEEIFLTKSDAEGERAARRWYWGHALWSIPSLMSHNLSWRKDMFGNYLKVALRSLLRHKVYSLINLTGLAMGMAGFILISIWVRDELAFDRFHPQSDLLCRVLNLSEGNVYTVTPGGLGPALAKGYPEITGTLRTTPPQRRLIRTGEKEFFVDDLILADPSLLDMFLFPLAKGDPESALTGPDTLLLTESLARRLFGDQDALGRSVILGGRTPCTVTGVLRDIPRGSSLKFSMVRPFDSLPERLRGWEDSQWHTYLRLEGAASPETVADRLTALARDRIPNSTSRYSLQPLTRIHLHSTHMQYDEARGDVRYVVLFSSLGLFLLMIACINFVNLGTARSGTRAREIGMRKVVGARRSDIIRQFLSESILLSFLALGLVLILDLAALPAFNVLSGKNLGPQALLSLNTLAPLIGITFLAGIASGSYPALILSGFRPEAALRGAGPGDSRRGGFRRALVAVQFSLTVFLIIGTGVIYRQLRFMQGADLGFRTDRVVYFQMRGGMREKYPAVKAELLRDPGVREVTASFVPIQQGSGTYAVWEGKRSQDEVHMFMASVDTNWRTFFGIELAAGRFFSPEFTTDAGEAYVVNQAAVRAMKLKNPVGARFSLGNDPDSGRIIGVIEDFHFRSLHTLIEPFILIHQPRRFWQMIVKIDAHRFPEGLAHLEKIWKKFVPEFPFEYRFVDDTIAGFYRTEQRIGGVFRTFTGLAVMIACLGLFGLAAFITERRTKEIGIRKVLGASDSGIVILLTRHVAGWVLSANLPAWPLAYLVMRRWLEGFAYRAPVPLWLFPTAALAALAVAVATVGTQSIRAARIDPADTLRCE